MSRLQRAAVVKCVISLQGGVGAAIASIDSLASEVLVRFCVRFCSIMFPRLECARPSHSVYDLFLPSHGAAVRKKTLVSPAASPCTGTVTHPRQPLALSHALSHAQRRRIPRGWVVAVVVAPRVSPRRLLRAATVVRGACDGGNAAHDRKARAEHVEHRRGRSGLRSNDRPRGGQQRVSSA